MHKHSAIARVVEASEDHLNWARDLPIASWNCVKKVHRGRLEVRLGLHGDNACGLNFAREFTLTDLVLVFGPSITVLDVNGQNECTGEHILDFRIVRLSF
jgi:hypothetical protein